MKYLVEPIVDNLSLGKEDHGVGMFGCPDFCKWDTCYYYGDHCDDYGICRTPTGPKMIHSGINPINIE